MVVDSMVDFSSGSSGDSGTPDAVHSRKRSPIPSRLCGEGWGEPGRGSRGGAMGSGPLHQKGSVRGRGLCVGGLGVPPIRGLPGARQAPSADSQSIFKLFTKKIEYLKIVFPRYNEGWPTVDLLIDEVHLDPTNAAFFVFVYNH